LYLNRIFHCFLFGYDYLFILDDKCVFPAMIRQAYILQVNTAVGNGKLLMNRIVPQEVDVLFVQVRNGKEQGYDSAHAERYDSSGVFHLQQPY
jgi:hypothetical protein